VGRDGEWKPFLFLRRLLVLVALVQRAAGCTRGSSLLAADDGSTHSADHDAFRLAVVLRLIRTLRRDLVVSCYRRKGDGRDQKCGTPESAI
jgi:hypothetical protein